MRIPVDAASVLGQRRVRLALAVVVAFLWFGLILATEDWVSPVLKLCFAAPAVLVFLWWRVRPLLALAMALLSLIVVLFGAANGSYVSAAALLALATGWLAILGGSLDHDQRVRWAAAGFLGVEALLALANTHLLGFLAVLVLGGLPVLAAWFWRRRTAERSLSDRLDASTQRGEAAERDVLIELERNRIAREVHDVVAHSLAVVIAQADGARFAAETKPETVAPALEAISDTARRALGEVRTMLHDLRTSGGGESPGAEDLAELVDGIRGLGVPVDEVVYGEPGPLDAVAGLALYRIAQEALTNAMRHGDREAPVGFELDWGERQVVLIVTNTIPAFAVPSSERAGQGLVGMRERALDAGGDCTAGTGSNGRFRVRVALPVQIAEVEPERAPDALTALLGRVGLEAHG